MAEQALSSETSANNEFTDAKAAEYLDYYLKAIGLEQPVESVAPSLMRLMADVPLELQLDSLSVPAKPETDRDKALAFFERSDWLPRQAREVTLASSIGVKESLRRARRVKVGKPERAQLSILKDVKRYYEESLRDNNVLNSVRTPSEDYDDIELDVEKLRTDRPALYVLAYNLMARESLDKDSWPSSYQHLYQERQSYWRGFMLLAGEYASDETLTKAFGQLLAKTVNRRKYWKEQYSFVHSRVGHLAVKDAVSERPLEEGTLAEDSEADHIAEEPVVEGDSQSAFEAMMPEAERRHMEKRREAYQAMYDKLQAQGMPEAEKQARLEQHFPEFTATGVLDHQEVRRISVERSKHPPTTHSRPNPAYSPWVRSQVGYDKHTDK